MLSNEYVYDDFQVIRDRDAIKDLQNVKELFSRDYFSVFMERTYCPVVTLSYMVDDAVFGGKPWGYHIASLLYHIVVSFIIYLLLIEFCFEKRYALLGALIFAVHPVHTETVSWITGRTDILSGLFYFLTVLLYARFTGSSGSKRKALYAVSLVAFTFAVFSKEMAVTLPVILLAYDIIIRYGCDLNKAKEGLLKAGTFAVYSGYVIIVLFLLFVRFFLFNQELYVGSGYPPGGVISILMTFCKIILKYVRLLLVPVNLTVDYNIPVSVSIFDRGIITSIMGVVALITVAVISLKKSKKFFFAVLFFLLTLLPVSNIIPFGILIAERYLYIPSLAYSILFAGAISNIMNTGNRNTGRFAVVAAVSALVMFSVITIKRNTEWKNEIILWSSAIRCFPDNPRVHNQLGNAYAQRNLYNEAIEEYLKARALKPDDAGTCYNLGVVYVKTGRYEEAVREFEAVKKISPEYKVSESIFAEAYASAGNYDIAVKILEDAIYIDPQNPVNYFKLASIYEREGNIARAVTVYENYIARDPAGFQAYNNLGILYGRMGLKEKEINMYKKAIQVNPDYFDAYFNLSLRYSGNNWDEVIKYLARAIEIIPGYLSAHYNLALAYENKGRASDAVAEYEKEINYNPSYSSAYKNLGILHWKAGDKTKAAKYWKKYVELEPDAPDAGQLKEMIKGIK